MTTVVKASSAADFLRLIPRILGYIPSESVVIVGFNGRRSTGAMRFDLPVLADVEGVTSTIVGLATRIEGIDGFAAIVYSSDIAIEGIGLPIVNTIQVHADRAGLPMNDGLVVASDGWVSSFDPELLVHPLDELVLEEDPALDAVGPVLANQAAGTELPEPVPGRSDAVVKAAAELAIAVDTFTNGTGGFVEPAAVVSIAQLDDLPEYIEQSTEFEPAAMNPHDVALFSWILSRPALRDIALVQWCSDRDGGDAALEAQLAWEAGEEYPSSLARSMWGEGPQPDADRLKQALELVRWVTALLPEKHRAGPLSTAAWLSWALGRSTHASAYAQMALAIDSQHGLAQIVESFTLAGHLPDWAFTKRAE